MPWVRVPPNTQNGDVAQMVEHLAEDQGVSGSIPFITTTLRGLEEKNFLS